ncbi:fumarylacetoacetate hydrolase family protein [Sphingobacterium sp. SRCM116780]|uniref:fumarylacetoacetate hydrolase family protein n=1 Tax=Sphingobacterium sp. SRCM116780 TaxID=2907623 RepID=UPI001F3DD51C|nr:fumarylacetoacetate hydrolase family protein [Sphingobacterium sp. SRCM116780]UIR54658.1 fumarylacetoacetate hydrolase family protein [Sphingobacterium sp. SRCM116780]
MKLVTCIQEEKESLGFVVDTNIHLCRQINSSFPDSMQAYLHTDEETKVQMKHAYDMLCSATQTIAPLTVNNTTLRAPVPYPSSLRDAYAFRQHVATSRRNRGLAMIPEFDLFPVFYFSNHRAICGPGEVACMPKHFDKLDFELEVAVVLDKQGKNICAADADTYIGGYMIMNDLSARTLQMEEMKLNLGPAKGKDFATVIGPWLVTPDELEKYRVATAAGHIGATYNLEMTCYVNGQLVSKGNLADMDWTFAEIIERVSYGVEMFPGDVIGSGTVGTGCFLELNGTGKLNNPVYEEQWLQAGDSVLMEVTGLGQLYTKIIAQHED